MNITQRLQQFHSLQAPTKHPQGPCILAYIRVSTKKQVEEGYSVDGQRTIIDKRVARDEHLSKLPILYFVDEAKSGKSIVGREAFEEIKQLAQTGDVIITWNLSRLGRNTRDMIGFIGEVRDKKVSLIITDIDFDTTTPIGDMLLTLLIAVAQLERQQTSERTKAIIQHKREQGLLITRPPYGFKANPDTKKLEPDEEEQKIITFIAGWIYEDPKIRDVELTRRLQEKLEAGEIVMRKSKRVYQASVHKIIERNNLRHDVMNLKN